MGSKKCIDELVSGNDSHEAGNSDKDASRTDRSSGFGTNIITLVRKFSKKLVVFSMKAHVDSKLRLAIRFGMISACVRDE